MLHPARPSRSEGGSVRPMDRVPEIRASHPLGKARQGKRTAHLAPGIGNRGNPLARVVGALFEKRPFELWGHRRLIVAPWWRDRAALDTEHAAKVWPDSSLCRWSGRRRSVGALVMGRVSLAPKSATTATTSA